MRLMDEPGGEAMRGEDSKQEAMFSYLSPEKRVPT
jgi:hypothetical protein